MAFQSQNFPGGPGGAEKPKDSIFASLAPQAPAPAPRPEPEVRLPAAEDIDALREKIEGMEKNIVSGIEKRLAEQVAAITAPRPLPPAPPPPGRTEADKELAAKMEALEKIISGFARESSLSAGMMKSIEESKIAARREIEDLLKAVRDQQKYSELDRQMHDQLEKSWKRVEETEKKLMDFYAVLMTAEAARRHEASEASLRIEKDSRAVYEGLQAMEKRLGGIEERLNERASAEDSLRKAASSMEEQGLQAMEKRLGGIEECLKEQRASVEDSLRKAVSSMEEQGRLAMEKRLGGIEECLNEQRASAEDSLRKAASSMEEQGLLAEGRLAAFCRKLEDNAAKALEQMRGGLEENLRSVRADAAESARLLKENTDFQSALLEEKSEARGRATAEKAEAAMSAAAARVTAEMSALAERITAAMNLMAADTKTGVKAVTADFASRMQAENAERFEKLGARYADALLALSLIDSFFLSVDEADKKVAAAGLELGAAFKDLDKEKVQRLSGVSGLVMREKLNSIENLRSRLAADSARLSEIRARLAEKVKSIFPGK